MIAKVILAAAQLLTVEMLDGRSVVINPDLVTHLSEARRDVEIDKQLTDGVNCVIFFSDSSYVTTGEQCTTIVNRWMKARDRKE